MSDPTVSPPTDWKAPVGRIEVEFVNRTRSRGTCFLVDDRNVLTAFHLLSPEYSHDWKSGIRHITIAFGHHVTSVDPQQAPHDASNDWALLECHDPPPVPPLPVGDVSERGVRWESYGFPDYAPDDGAACGGEVRDASATSDDLTAIQLYCLEAAAGDGAPVRGYSGAPCIVNGRVVGLIRSALQHKRRSVAGTLYACPLAVLPEDILPKPPTTPFQSDPVVAELHKAIEAFCQSQPYLSLQTIQPHRPLDDIYVNLRTRQRRDRASPSTKAVSGRPTALHEASFPISPAEMMADSSQFHVMIIGEPGAGKSTLLRYFARHALERPNSIGLSASHFPLPVTLPAIARSSGSMFERITAAMRQELGIPISSVDIQALAGRVSLMLLLDGLDEVPNDARPQLLSFLNLYLPGVKPHRAVLTSRPSGYAMKDLSPAHSQEFELLPFSESQTEEFASHWFPESASSFLLELDRLCPIELRGTPLLLTIAAKVFAAKGSLPERRAALYRSFVRIWLNEAVFRNLNEELHNPRIAKLVPHLLRSIAHWVSSSHSSHSTDEVAKHVESECVRILGLTREEARCDAQIFLDAVGRRSGVFIRSGNKYVFAHPTFREYLTADAIAEGTGDDTVSGFRQIEGGGLAGTWRQIAIFFLGLTSDRGHDVSSLLTSHLEAARRCHWRGSDNWGTFVEDYDRIAFLAECIGDSARVTASVRREVVAALNRVLSEVVTQEGEADAGELLEMADGPIRLLGMLRDSPEAADVLHSIITDEKCWGYLRFHAMESMVRGGLHSADLERLLSWAFGKELLYESVATLPGSRVSVPLVV